MMLKNKVAIVTGTRSGIGKTIAEIFAEEKAKVVTCTREAPNCSKVAEDIRNSGGEAIFVKCNVSIEEDVKNAVKVAIDTYGRIDIIVNNAGVYLGKPFEQTDTNDWDRVINTDLKGTYFFCRYGIMEMLKTGGGSIINITSVHSIAGHPEAGPYDAAKWGIVGLTKALATEYASRNIRVNALSPGLIDTQMYHDLLDNVENREECIDYWKSNIPMGRPGTTLEVARAVTFLASDESSYFTGSNILIDGGLTALLVSKPSFKYKPIEKR